MKKLCGVVAEFDPFHSGHALLLQQARGLTGCQHVAVIMSACFTQRGSPALIRPHARAHMALLNGADLVAALPAVWSLRDAEHFALGTVSSLELMGCDSICFGSECGDIDLICRTALALQEPNPMMLAAIHSRLDAGMSYPAAMEAALRLVMP